MGANCPKCGSNVTRVNLVNMSASAVSGRSWNAVAYTCPTCDVVLSVGIDPIALKTDTINGVLDGVRQMLR